MKTFRIILVFMLLLLGACSQKEALKPPPPAPKELPVVYHQVRFKGETLALIAKWYTGNPKNWKVIAEMNPEMNPNRIVLDEVIRIPKDLAIKDKAYTLKEFRKLQGAAKPSAPTAKGDDLGIPPAGGSDYGPSGQAPARYDDLTTAPTSDPAAEKRKEIQEKTRYELLQEMLGDKGE